MSCEILKNGEEILQCSSTTFNLLYVFFTKFFEQYHALQNNRELAHFMEHMEMYIDKGGSYWFDISNYIKESKNMALLNTMMQQFRIKIGPLTNDKSQAIFASFHAELIKYKEELEAQGR